MWCVCVCVCVSFCSWKDHSFPLKRSLTPQTTGLATDMEMERKKDKQNERNKNKGTQIEREKEHVTVIGCLLPDTLSYRRERRYFYIRRAQLYMPEKNQVA